MNTRQFEQAIEKFTSLKDYESSEALLRRCEKLLEEDEEVLYPILNEQSISEVYEGGILYYCKYGPLYVPNEVDSSTGFMLYHSGGGGAEDYLYYKGLYPYFEDYSPNAVMLFCNNSGYDILKGKNESCYKLLSQVAKELGITLHDLSLVGSSQGCFTALKAAYQFYVNHELAAVCVVTLDTGMEWIDPANLNEEECLKIAEAGTVFYLFEQADTGMNVEEIRLFVESGIETYLVACAEKQHNTISVNAYKYGIFDWSVGEDIELPPWQYTFIKLEPGMEDNGEVSWAENPNPTPTVYWW